MGGEGEGRGGEGGAPVGRRGRRTCCGGPWRRPRGSGRAEGPRRQCPAPPRQGSPSPRAKDRPACTGSSTSLHHHLLPPLLRPAPSTTSGRPHRRSSSLHLHAPILYTTARRELKEARVIRAQEIVAGFMCVRWIGSVAETWPGARAGQREWGREGRRLCLWVAGAEWRRSASKGSRRRHSMNSSFSPRISSRAPP